MRKCSKGGVSGLAEDLRPVSEVEAGKNFRPDGQLREQVVEQSPVRRPGLGSRPPGGAVTPSVLYKLFQVLLSPWYPYTTKRRTTPSIPVGRVTLKALPS